LNQQRGQSSNLVGWLGACEDHPIPRTNQEAKGPVCLVGRLAPRGRQETTKEPPEEPPRAPRGRRVTFPGGQHLPPMCSSHQICVKEQHCTCNSVFSHASTASEIFESHRSIGVVDKSRSVHISNFEPGRKSFWLAAFALKSRYSKSFSEGCGIPHVPTISRIKSVNDKWRICLKSFRSCGAFEQFPRHMMGIVPLLRA
jgi:hypothetical protein